MNRVIELMLSLPKSIYVNLRLFGMKGFKCPLLLRYDVDVKGCANGVVALKRFRFKEVTIGFGGTDSVSVRPASFHLKPGSTMIFKGTAQFSRGIIIKNKGKIVFGDNFHANKNCSISCSDTVTFGDDCLLGWNVYIRDADGHTVRSLDNPTKPDCGRPAGVCIGNHVWISSECHFLKGSSIPDNCVVGYKSLVNKRFEEKNCIIAGHPSTVVKRNIEWQL
ncbi:MAG: acyltransferase [Muribaculaceae bacterium]|nr:acyltransferase [Muribaculaceae bacterium]